MIRWRSLRATTRTRASCEFDRQVRGRPLAGKLARSLTLAATALALPGGLLAADSPRRTRLPVSTERSVQLGLEYLSREANHGQTGAFRDDPFPVAANALAGLAFLAGGTTEEEGEERYSATLRRITTTLLGYQKPSGYFDDGADRSRMYGHGFATLYLAQLYGTSSKRPQTLRNALRLAVRLIEGSQGREGGWDYLPANYGPRARPQYNDVSITVCQTLALRAARNLGIAVDGNTVQRARDYIRRAQNADGGFRYRLEDAFERQSALPRSAAGVCILYSLGDYSSTSIRRGIEYLEKEYRSVERRFPHYAHFYCSQALFQVGGRTWREYYEWASQRLSTNQLADGSWRPSPNERSPVVQTAMALVILQLPYRYLPIHER